jgi:hypothetical protein
MSAYRQMLESLSTLDILRELIKREGVISNRVDKDTSGIFISELCCVGAGEVCSERWTELNRG